MQRAVERVHADSDPGYAVDLVAATRERPGPDGRQSPRHLGSAQAGAGEGRARRTRLVTPDDVKRIAVLALRTGSRCARAVDPARPRGRGARVPRRLPGSARASETRRSDHLGLAAACTYAALAAVAPCGARTRAAPSLPCSRRRSCCSSRWAAGAALALDGGLRLERERALEGEHVGATVTVQAGGAPARVEVHCRRRRGSTPTPFRSPSGSPAASGVRSGSSSSPALGRARRDPRQSAHAIASVRSSSRVGARGVV